MDECRRLDMVELAQAVRIYLTITSPEIFGQNGLSIAFRAKKTDEDLEVWAELRRVLVREEEKT